MLKEFISVLCLLNVAKASNWKIRNETEGVRRFPNEFMFGASTSSYQIEGAWNEGGKGVHMWDYVMRTSPEYIANGTKGDVAANSYYLYKRDVEMLKELGVQTYRFSISWTRILPFGRPNWVNTEGIDYYNKLIDELIANGITPFVTIYHWELPQNLNEQGGWLTEDIVQWFGDYARVLFQYFGDRVKYWITVNEPFIHCEHGYAIGNHAPRVKSPATGFYTCGRNILLAHARAFHIYKEEFKSQGGEIGIALNCDMAIPSDDSEESKEAVLDYYAFYLGQYMDPIFTEQGNYPQRLIDRVGNNSAAQGLPESRLRPFTEEQVSYIRKTADFLALNSYTSNLVYRNESLFNSFDTPSYRDDIFIGAYKDSSWVRGNSWLYSNPPGLHQLLLYIKDTYDPVVYITENGFPTQTGLNDDLRVTYLKGHLQSVLKAIEDGVDVRGYCFWSLMDTFEWDSGYTLRLGLYELDIEDPQRTRTPRKSALVYSKITRNRAIDLDYNPDPYKTY